MPAALITLSQVAISDLINAASCSGVLATVSTPALKNFSLTSGLLSIRTISWLRRLSMAWGVFAGAIITSGETDSNPGIPAAATVGNPGATADGCALVTARALNLSDFK